MKSTNLAVLAAQNAAKAAAHVRGREITVVHGADGRALRQVVVTMKAGGGLPDHENPGNASLYVLDGRVRMESGGETWEGATGDFLIIPTRRHNLEAIDDAAVLLTFARIREGADAHLDPTSTT